MWSWVAHRVTGVLIFFFLFAHVLDTALVRVSPDSYNRIMDTYKTPLVNLMEVGLVGAVLFHALNGLRVTAIDFWAKGTRYQKQMMWVGARRLHRRHGPRRLPHDRPHVRRAVREHLVTAIDETGSLKAGSIVQPDDQDRMVIESPRTRRKRPTQGGRGTNFEMYAWIFMRMSGLLLVFLVLGHLFIMLLLDDGVKRINFGFVAGRWASPFWRTWDLMQLWLAQLHGTNGLRRSSTTTPSATAPASGSRCCSTRRRSSCSCSARS
jgi:succinate dehydrogenase cytochrome b556 subunit